MKKLIIVYVVLIIALILLVVFKSGGNLLSFVPFVGGHSGSAQINGKKINLTIVKDEKARQKGLSGRKSLGKNDGMLFVFDHPDLYGFWMKDMLFSIDIIYINDDKVVYVVKNAPAPEKGDNSNLKIYRPDTEANYVLEVNAGKSDELEIKKGTTVTLKGI